MRIIWNQHVCVGGCTEERCTEECCCGCHAEAPEGTKASAWWCNGCGAVVYEGEDRSKLDQRMKDHANVCLMLRAAKKREKQRMTDV